MVLQSGERSRIEPTTRAATRQGIKARVEWLEETDFAEADADAANHGPVSLDKQHWLDAKF